VLPAGSVSSDSSASAQAGKAPEASPFRGASSGLDLARPAEPSEEERELLRCYVDAHERADADALAELLRADARLTMPPHPTWYAGREAIRIAARQGFDPAFGRLRTLVTAAIRQPAAAHYRRRPGESQCRPLALDVLRVEGQRVAEITSFVFPGLFPAFGLPPALPER
jgi:RNA polymerase sigma-70 factor (ECF subfamily)